MRNWDACTDWPVPPAHAQDVALVEIGIATSILTGEYDMLMPKPQSEIVQEGLSDATLVDVPVTAHGIVPQRLCAESTMAEFLDDPSGEPNLDCLDEIEPIVFA